jgi:hypothetical protein
MSKTQAFFIVLVTITAHLLPAVSAESLNWMQNNINPKQLGVSENTEIEWRLMASKTVEAGDCLILEFNDPYESNSPKNYSSFEPNSYFDCFFSTGNRAICSTTDHQTLQIKFTESSNSYQIAGQTSDRPFKNAYSARSIRDVTVALYDQCNLGSEPLVFGTASMPAFTEANLPKSKVSFTSNSEQIAATDAELTVKFTPRTTFKSTGRVSVQAPAWFIISDDRIPHLLSSESMLGFTSEGYFPNHPQYTVTNNVFDQGSRTLTIEYEGPRDTSDEEIVLKISDLKNPVNRNLKEGFRINLADSLGYLIEQSPANLPLDTPMTINGELESEEIQVLGDESGQNQGMVSSYNKLALYLSSHIPFEKNCYFKFVFPPKL